MVMTCMVANLEKCYIYYLVMNQIWKNTGEKSYESNVGEKSDWKVLSIRVSHHPHIHPQICIVISIPQICIVISILLIALLLTLLVNYYPQKQMLSQNNLLEQLEQ